LVFFAPMLLGRRRERLPTPPKGLFGRDPAAASDVLLVTHSSPPATTGSANLDFTRVGISGVRLEALFEAIPLAIAIFDGDLRLVNTNVRYRELTGVAASPQAKLSIYDAFPNALADLTDHIDTALRGTSAPATARVPFQHRAGRRLIETTFATLTDESGR